VIALFRDQLDYRYVGDRTDRDLGAVLHRQRV